MAPPDPIIAYKTCGDDPAFIYHLENRWMIPSPCGVKLDGCDEKPTVDVLSKDGDDMKVTRKTFKGGKDGSEVVLVSIEGGGHTWPWPKTAREIHR